MASTGKIAAVMFDEMLQEYETQDMLLGLVDRYEPDGGTMQNANNFVWRPVQQHAPILSGWDLAGQEQDIIEQTYPAVLGTPSNDFISQRADDLRDMRFWERRGRESGKRQASYLNQTIAQAMSTQGSMFYQFDTNTTSPGYKFVAEGQALMNERQGYQSQRNFLINDRDMLAFSGELSGRQTLQGRPEETWKTGQIGQNIAEFDVYTGSFLPTLAGGASPDTTVTADQSFAPEGGSVDAVTGVVTNVDYRSATLPVADSSGYAVGDKVTFENGGTPVYAVGLDDKTNSNQAMTFTIVAIPDGTSVTVYPKPIAADDPGLTATEAAYANIDTQILDTAVVVRQNTLASAKTNLFWDEDAVEVLSGNIPAELFKQYDGMKTMTHTMKNGQKFYMVYDGNIENMTFRYRIFTWWGVTIRDPSRVGVATTFST